jgi:hypothetical protein
MRMEMMFFALTNPNALDDVDIFVVDYLYP